MTVLRAMSEQLNITNKWMRPHCWCPKTNNGQWQTFYQLCLLHWLPLCCAMLSPFSCVWLFVTPWTVACQAPLPRGCSRQEYWSGLPWPPLGALPDSGIKPASPVSLSLAGKFSTTSATWEALGTFFGVYQKEGSEGVSPAASTYLEGFSQK